MRVPGLVLGYHGCDRAVAEKILEGKTEVRKSTNSFDWLGSGAYFWENNPARALSWAKLLTGRSSSTGKPQIEKPAVVGAIIDPGNCLDLAEESSLALLRTAYSGFERLYSESDGPLPENEEGFRGDADLIKRHLDCAVVNFLHQLRKIEGQPSFDTVRAPFIEGKPLFAGSKLMDKCHVPWCVQNPKKSIIAYFRPRDANATEV
jgi:hypothetical protein